MSEIIVGIDLGTTNSLVAICDARGPRVIPDPQGRVLLPSVVRYEPGEEGGVRRIVGYEARDHAAEFPATTVASVKRLMGRSLADAAGDLPFLSYRVVEGAHGQARIALPISRAVGPADRTGHTAAGHHGNDELILSPQEVSADILRALRRQASQALGMEVRKAVVTVPAYFDDAQRQATRDAGRIAGLDVVRIVNEPTAAALAYGVGLRTLHTERGLKRQPATLAVYDLGGGTFDISILRLIPGEGEGTDFFRVISTAGDTHLGGDDVDHMLVDLFQREIAQQRRDADRPLALLPGVRQGLRMAAEQAKCRLSFVEETAVEVPLGDGTVYARRLTRAELEAMITPWVERTIEACARALRDAERELDHTGRGVEAVILVGGATRTPLVRRRVAEFFALEPYTALDPDQVVALGAAVQGAVMSGTLRGALLLDVVPLSLGIETAGGAVAKLIMRNTTVPARAVELFSTSVDGQTSIKLHVLQGEREMAADCRSLGVFHLRGLPPMPAGVPQVEVEFLVDVNGVLNVSARERRSGRQASLQIIPNHGLTREEVERMEAEAFAHARDDMTRHRVVDLTVNARLDLKWIGDALERLRDQLEPAYVAELERHMATVRDMIEAAERDWRSVDPDRFLAARNALDQASVRLQEISIAQSLRQVAGQTGGSATDR